MCGVSETSRAKEVKDVAVGGRRERGSEGREEGRRRGEER